MSLEGTGNFDEVRVYNNTKWFNFIHSTNTQILVALSVVGGIFYMAYLLMKGTQTTVESEFDIPISGNSSSSTLVSILVSGHHLWPMVQSTIDSHLAQGEATPDTLVVSSSSMVSDEN